jgi:hypothetical protein
VPGSYSPFIYQKIKATNRHKALREGGREGKEEQEGRKAEEGRVGGREGGKKEGYRSKKSINALNLTVSYFNNHGQNQVCWLTPIISALQSLR